MLLDVPPLLPLRHLRRFFSHSALVLDGLLHQCRRNAELVPFLASATVGKARLFFLPALTMHCVHYPSGSQSVLFHHPHDVGNCSSTGVSGRPVHGYRPATQGFVGASPHAGSPALAVVLFGLSFNGSTLLRYHEMSIQCSCAH